MSGFTPFKHFSHWLTAFLLLVCPSLQVLQSFGTTVQLEDIHYYVPSEEVGLIDVKRAGLHGTGLRPITVLNHGAESDDEIHAALSKYTAGDDVWQHGFLEAVILHSDEALTRRTLVARSTTLMDREAKVVHLPQTNLSNGPYFLDAATGNVYKGLRLYSDFAEAFTSTLVETSGTFSTLPANVPGQNLAVGVPSRMHYKKTKEKPLAGVRIGIKDIYDIQGIRTGDGNRAYYYFYPPANGTGTAVQRLIDAGAYIVGKMKTSQFANGEMATADWVDYHEPFNPRGDGYQDTSSSSAGPGAGEASYPWLDITLGSDTGGSIRGPSEVQGLFGNRPSHGLVSLDHVMPLAPQLDTAGFISRDPTLWAEAANVLYDGGVDLSYSFPKEILLLNFPTKARNPSEKVLLDFVSAVTNFLKANATQYSISDDFSNNTPKKSPTSNVDELLDITYPILISQEQVRLVADPFYEAYAAAYHGRRPFIDPVPLVRWAYGNSFPATATQEALKNKTIFADWFNSHVLGPDTETCSDKLLFYVGSEADPNPRNQYLNPPSPPIGFSSGRISSFSGAPDFVFPIGQAPYHSSITHHREYLPVTVDVMAHPKCDGLIFELANKLVQNGILAPSMTGRKLKGGGKILFKRSLHSN